MKQNKNPFRKPARPQQEEVQQPKSTSDMTDAELEESLRQARRDLLEAQRDALREREKARVAPEDGGRTSRRNLGTIFNKSNRRFK